MVLTCSSGCVSNTVATLDSADGAGKTLVFSGMYSNAASALG